MWEDKYVVRTRKLYNNFTDEEDVDEDTITQYLDKNNKVLYSINEYNEIQNEFKSEEEYLQTLK